MASDARTDEERSADERAIRALHGAVLDAWGAGNGKAFAAPFSDDALFIGFAGSMMRGRRIEPGLPRRAIGDQGNPDERTTRSSMST